MKILIIILLVLGLACFIPVVAGGPSWERTADEREGDTFFVFLGSVLLCVDLLIFVIWSVLKS